jgi:hypothetical protein
VNAQVISGYRKSNNGTVEDWNDGNRQIGVTRREFIPRNTANRRELPRIGPEEVRIAARLGRRALPLQDYDYDSGWGYTDPPWRS